MKPSFSLDERTYSQIKTAVHVHQAPEYAAPEDPEPDYFSDEDRHSYASSGGALPSSPARPRRRLCRSRLPVLPSHLLDACTVSRLLRRRPPSAVGLLLLPSPHKLPKLLKRDKVYQLPLVK